MSKWICVAGRSGETLSISSMRTVGLTGHEQSALHRWVWQHRQPGAWATIEQQISDGRGDTGDDVVLITVTPVTSTVRGVRSAELRAGATGDTPVLAAERSASRPYHYYFRPSVAEVRELASTAQPVAVVFLDGRGQAVETVPLDINVVGRARAEWRAAIARSLDMTRNYASECQAEFDRPLVIA